MDIGELLQNIKKNNLAQMESDTGEILTMFYWEELSDPQDFFYFSMCNPGGEDPNDKTYDLALRLPFLALREENGIYLASFQESYDLIWDDEYEIKKGKIIGLNEFSEIDPDAIDTDDIGKLIRLTIPGNDNYVVGHIAALDTEGAMTITPVKDLDSPIIIEKIGFHEHPYILKDPNLKIFIGSNKWEAIPIITSLEITPVMELAIENRYPSMF